MNEILRAIERNEGVTVLYHGRVKGVSCLSVPPYMGLLQRAKEKRQHEYILDFLYVFGFQILPLSENMGHRAAIYVQEYSLSHGLRAGDAIIAATATENALTLCTSNVRRYRPTKELKLRVFNA